MYFLKIKTIFLYLFLTSIIICLIVFAQDTIHCVKSTLYLCYQTLFPSLFPFFVVSSVFIDCGGAQTVSKLLSRPTESLFKVSGAGAFAFLIGAISGYPTGAKAVSELYLKGTLQKKEATRLLCYCNNSGPLFIIGAVGTGMLKNTELGLYLYCVHIFCVLFIAFLFRFHNPHPTVQRLTPNQAKRLSFTESFTHAVPSAMQTTLCVCAFVTIFSVFSAFILRIFNGGCIALILNSLLEVTGGCNTVCQSVFSLRIKLSLLSFLLAFGGICVLLQVAAVSLDSKLSLKTYLFGKAFFGIVSFITTYLTFPFFDFSVPSAVNPENLTKKMHFFPYFLFCFLILVVYILIKIKRKHIYGKR